ncbi:MAG TPA: hypothetical protein VFJ82_10715 [Longimicrobium sp.]|nr:hypothetical protein [Longimicrobium sp.]
MNHISPRAVAVAALAGLPLLLAPAPAEAQTVRRAITRAVAVFTGQLETAVEGRDAPAARPAPPRDLPQCGTLYDQNVRTLAEGPELLRSYTAWLASATRIIQESGGMPLPICFTWNSDSLDTNQARTLLHVNNRLMRPADEYALIGHSDPSEPVEKRLALARGRAETIQAQSPGPTCRFEVRANLADSAKAFRRKVTYSSQQTCANPPTPHIEGGSHAQAHP